MKDAFNQLIYFLEQLKLAKIHHSIEYNREEAIMVIAVVPGERWEIEFFQNGTIEIEVFRSDGKISGKEKLSEFISRFVLQSEGFIEFRE